MRDCLDGSRHPGPYIVIRLAVQLIDDLPSSKPVVIHSSITSS
jgi:hypothetical protein